MSALRHPWLRELALDQAARANFVDSITESQDAALDFVWAPCGRNTSAASGRAGRPP